MPQAQVATHVVFINPFESYDEIRVIKDNPAVYCLDSNQKNRFDLGFERAMGRASNPRNLEIHWCGPWFIVISALHGCLQNVTVETQWPISELVNQPAALDRTLPLRRGTTSVIPDLLSMLRKDGLDYIPMLAEQKKNTRRGDLDQKGYPVNERGTEGLTTLLRRAAQQVRRQGSYLFKAKPQQNIVALLATAGPWGMITIMSRESARAEMEDMATTEAEYLLEEENSQKELETDLGEDMDVDNSTPTVQRDSRHLAQLQTPLERGWSKPFLLGTGEAQMALSWLKMRLHTFVQNGLF